MMLRQFSEAILHALDKLLGFGAVSRYHAVPYSKQQAGCNPVTIYLGRNH
jgi:hypothetical protein